MFSKEFNKKIEERLDYRINELGLTLLKDELEKLKETEDTDVMEGLNYLYAYMPLSDIGDYKIETFLDFARHGAFLFNEGEFKGKVNEEMFAEYVLFARINNEDIVENRRFFYNWVKSLIKGKTMKEAVIEINYWCSSKVTYRSTDGRTANPITVYNNTYGRCGEESTFGVSVFRSAGIPARQVYVPLWSHCDDNHAWVEVWCDGKWYFLGACEPEDELNQGWFLNASKRAMMVHARCYNPELEKDVNEGDGIPVAVNVLSTYAPTKEMSVRVVNEKCEPLPNTKVYFKVINYSVPGEIAVTCTDNNGVTRLKTGSGSLIISAYKDGTYGEVLVDTGKTTEVELKLKSDGYKEVEGSFIMRAPSLENPVKTETAANHNSSDERRKAEAGKRAYKEDSLFNEETAEWTTKRFKREDEKLLTSALFKSCENQRELERFITENREISDKWKVKMIEYLLPKDYQDTEAETLFEHCLYTDGSLLEKYPEEIFYKYILCPRVDLEKIVPYRKYLSEKFKDAKVSDIGEIRTLFNEVDTLLKEKPEFEYSTLYSTAYGAFTIGYASKKSKRVIFIELLRSLGIPSRLNPKDKTMEVYLDGEFIAVELSKESQKGSLELVFATNVNWSYYENFSLSVFADGDFLPLDLDLEELKKDENVLELNIGIYRLITSNRLPNGNIFVKSAIAEVREGERTKLAVDFCEADISDMLSDYPIRNIVFENDKKKETSIKEITKDNNAIFIWLSAKAEPTEHILNELYGKRELFNSLKTKVYLVVKSEDELEDANIKRVVDGLSNRDILFESFDTEAGKLARELYLEPGLYPLICVVDKEGRGVYATAGYNVGTADMLLKICGYLEEENHESGH